MTSGVQATLMAAAAASSRKMPSSVHTQSDGSSAASIYAHNYQKQSFSSVYSVRQGNNGTTINTSCTSYTDGIQMQTM
ncbi:hypothetical protein LOAG_03561 [Loa loa]|uniref:Secreted protein n=1 Tax=Loa loa TaxID=7209 RepID=A0A1I7VUM0_LOALO|nr:hypothetical protein LOAG_03561 [Loa loa]EFO24926.2 hypothetical protein LOAG_03561 [Loa loa]